MRALAAVGIVAGETGAAGLASLLAFRDTADPATRTTLGLAPEARVLILNTEGATDPGAYAEIIDGQER